MQLPQQCDICKRVDQSAGQLDLMDSYLEHYGHPITIEKANLVGVHLYTVQ